MKQPAALHYLAEAVLDENRLVDVRLHFQDKTWSMWGRAGLNRELALAESRPPQTLPVLIGSGVGAALARLLESGPVAVIDREIPLLEATQVREAFGDHPLVFWLDAPDPEETLQRLASWRAMQGGRPLAPLPIPIYLRLRPDYYALLMRRMQSPQLCAQTCDLGQANAAQAPGAPKIRLPRPLLITSQYFLMGEVIAALQRMGVEHRMLDVGAREMERQDFVQMVLAAVREFEPDFALTVNHLGVDHEGVLMDILDTLRLPLASWFVDDPRLILGVHRNVVHPLVTLFTWDADTVEPLRASGFRQVHYLPLGADPTRFHPNRANTGRPEWKSDVSFVGNSMVEKTARRLEAAAPPPLLARSFPLLAREYGASDFSSVEAFLAHRLPQLLPDYRSLPTPGRRLAFDTAVIWEATRRYRLDCVRRLAPFSPLVAGDPGWRNLLEGARQFRFHPEISYYSDLPGFYQRSKINFNCTSRQMKGAVNQRVFDAPAGGCFVLTDAQAQLEDLFEPGKEVAVYQRPEDVEDAVRRYLDDPEERRRISKAGRRRVLADHTYERRMAKMLSIMAQTLA